MVIRGALAPPQGPVHYNLIVSDPQARVLHGVDHSAYSAQLASDMGAAPYPWEVLREHGLVVAFVYCFGAAFPTLFRLLGPYRHREAPQIAKTELLETIARRGVVGNIAMGLIPILFYALVNLLALAVEYSVRLAELVLPSVFSFHRLEKYLERRTGSFRAYDNLSDAELLALGQRSKAVRRKRAEEQWHKLGFASSREAEKILSARQAEGTSYMDVSLAAFHSPSNAHTRPPASKRKVVGTTKQ